MLAGVYRHGQQVIVRGRRALDQRLGAPALQASGAAQARAVRRPHAARIGMLAGSTRAKRSTSKSVVQWRSGPAALQLGGKGDRCARGKGDHCTGIGAGRRMASTSGLLFLEARNT
jgi:hypothetical protein